MELFSYLFHVPFMEQLNSCFQVKCNNFILVVTRIHELDVTNTPKWGVLTWIGESPSVRQYESDERWQHLSAEVMEKPTQGR